MKNMLIRLGLPFTLLTIDFSAYAVDAEDAATLTESLGIKKINSATVVHSPHGFSNQRKRTTAFITNQKTLAAMHKLLAKLPAEGGVSKDWPEHIGHRRIYLHANDQKVISLNIYGHSLQSPLDATFSAPESDPQNAELTKLLEHIDQIELSQRFRSRSGPVGKLRESDWRPTKRDRDKIIASVKEHDRERGSIGKPKDWQWDVAELYVDGKDNHLLWIFHLSRNRVKVWRWVELKGEMKPIRSSGSREG